MPGRNPDARVADLDSNLRAPAVSLAGPCANFHFAFAGELDRVGNQVPHQLPQTQDVADDSLRKAPIEGLFQLQSFRSGLEGELCYHSLQRLAERILLFFQMDVVG